MAIDSSKTYTDHTSGLRREPIKILNKQKMKSYLLISPQVWGDMYISKHNYALELAEMGHTVYFLNPPFYKQNISLPELSITEKFPNLYLIDYTLSNAIHFLRFKARSLFDFIIKKALIKKINQVACFDEVWCFEPNIFSDIRPFNAGKKLLFLVDHHANKNLQKLALTVDGIASISPVILDYFDFAKKPKLLINHGLNKNFSDLARLRISSGFTYNSGKQLSVAYVGNLFMGSKIDTGTMQRIIEKHTEVSFQFFGPGDKKNNTLGFTTDDELDRFISFLKQQPNVLFHGVLPQHELARKIHEVDAFLISYDYINDVNKSSNSHKILEYLSTGKVVISNRIITYENTSGLLEMPLEYTNENLPALFDKVIFNIEQYNSVAAQKQRVEFALQNTYASHVNTISNFLATAAAS